MSDISYAVIGRWSGRREVWRAYVFDSIEEARERWDSYISDVSHFFDVSAADDFELLGFLEITCDDRDGFATNFISVEEVS